MTEPNAPLPTCVGFIMDGNRRWAKARDLPTLEGHRKGAEVFEEIIRSIRDQQIPHAVFYAFSSENWKRPEAEVDALLNLFAEYITRLQATFNNPEQTETKVRFRFVGDTTQFSRELQILIQAVEDESAAFTTTTIWIALSYGGRAEIVQAVNEAVAKGSQIDEFAFSALLWTAEMPDPDLIIRTGGQQRLSNFLPWQSVYSELVFLSEYWPDFTGAQLKEVLMAFQSRQRNFGV